MRRLPNAPGGYQQGYMQRLLHAIELAFGDKADRVAGVIYIGEDQKLVFLDTNGDKIEGLAGLDARYAPAGVPYITEDDAGEKYLTPAQIDNRYAPADEPYITEDDAGEKYLTPAQIDNQYVNYSDDTNGWNLITYQNGWARFAASTANCQYRKRYGDVVEIRGLVGGGTPQDSETGTGVIFTLPAGYRPGTRLIIPALSNEKAARLDVYPSGKVVAASTQAAWNSISWFGFNTSFYVG